MSYIAPIFRPSSVRQAISAHVRSYDALDLVIALANRLEIWSLEESSSGRILQKIHTEVIHGNITILQKIQPKEWPAEVLFVGTERMRYFTAAWNHDTGRLETKQTFTDAGEKHMRDSQSQDKCIVDPSGKFMAMHLWEGVLNVLRVSPRKNPTHQLEWLEQIRLTELMIRASAFLHSETGHPKIAFLFQGKPDVPDTQLAVYRLTADDKNTKSSKFDPAKDREISIRNLEPGATLLIPVEKVEQEKRHNVRNPQSAKAYIGGLIVVGETALTYIDSLTKCTVESALKEPSIFVAWAQYDVTHYLLADDYGILHMLTLDVGESLEVTGISVQKVGRSRTSRASCLVYLGDGYVYLGSHHGKPQFLQIQCSQQQCGPSHPTETWKFTEVQSFTNIAPILDFAVMDMGNREGVNQSANEFSSGQARIVAGCGVWDDGVLNSIRSGVGLEDIGILAEMDSIRGLFPMRLKSPKVVDCLLVSFPTETRAFRFDPEGEIEEVSSFQGLALDTHTLLASLLPNGRLLQVTPSSVTLTDAESGVRIAAWDSPNGTITAASANNKWVLLSVEGKNVVSLNISEELKLAKEASAVEDQVACLHLSPQFEDIGIIGVWSGGLSLVDAASLMVRAHQSLQQDGDAEPVPRDLALVKILPSSPTLFVAMSDGVIVNFAVSPEDFSLTNRRSVILGTRYSKFHLMPNSQTDTFNIFSTSEHPSLIYGSEGRIVYSAVTAEDALCVCPFDIPAFPNAVALATDTTLKICQVEPERRTHVKSAAINEVVRRVAYSPKEKVFGIGCIKRELSNGDETIASSFRLVDEIIFESVGKPFPLDDAPATEMVETVIRTELPDSYGNPAERFIVGTSYMEGDETVRANVVNGRILVLGVDGERNPYLIAQHKLKGSCRRLSIIGDKIVASLSKVVAVYLYREETTLSGTLERVASYRPSTAPVDMAIHGNMIAVGDLMKSMTLVEYIPSQNGTTSHTLVERARHLQAAWTTSLAYVGDENWLLSDAQGNLMTLRQNMEGATEDDKRRLDVTSEINLGEMVNRIRDIEVESSPDAIVVPKAFIGTVEGGMYLFGSIGPKWQDLLLRFQSSLADSVETLGEIDFKSSYRAFRNEEREGEEPFRFVDGELLERFLDLAEESQQQVCQGLGPSVEVMRNIVEELKRIH
ncbi:hypothetical protein MKZ38_003157 [Zalerion maritima]|uniref:DNA damage-binding protein 1 n=1 Tax=Zalerion maritima TaxID=339359 RepID=A0AAD5S002_9PEZI|nr:hypothetical protein MKZ38_003157 [Zalerion maritima]